MSKILFITFATILVTAATVATTLATISGAIGAVDWASHTFGPVPVALTGAFIAGATTMHAVNRGLAARRRSLPSHRPRNRVTAANAPRLRERSE
jgi:hypothetical protein